MGRHSFFRAIVALSVIALVSSQSLASDWGQWRGPNRDGHVSAESWPDSLESLQPTWSKTFGPSYSGPVVVGDHVFTTETKDKKYEVTYALNRKDGKQSWSKQWEGAMSVPFFAWSNGSWIRSTPTLDDGKIYVAGMRDLLVCMDAASGEEVWRLDFVKQFSTPLPAFGLVCSPLIVGDDLYVQAGAAVVKLNKKTGEVQWRGMSDEGGMYGSAFSSPVFASIGGVNQLVVQTRTTLAGLDPANGKTLWSEDIPAFRGMNILTPTVIDNKVFTSSYGGKTFMFEVNNKDSKWSVQEKWTNKTQGYMSSPIVIDGHIYMHLKNQRFTCIDWETGAEKWTTTPFGKYWSMVTNGKKILALDEKGELLLIKANPERFELLDRKEVSDSSSWAHVGISDGQVFVRSLNSLSTYSWK
ncbi:MAG: outer membrane protein assembly factor BamB [Pirellulaceae bacterium]|jgi:outer membrane protein assembly factor BamB